MAKEAKFQGKQDSDKDKKLGTTSSDDIKSAGSGKPKEEKKFNDKKRGKFKNSKGGNFRRGTNDPSWYVANPTIVKDVASLPFAVYNGVTYNTFSTQINKLELNNNSNFTQNVPGVAIYKYSPWYGTATATSALNLTMRALYSFVRHVNSGRTNYEAPDLMMYIMAMDSVYLLIHEIKRLIRLAYLYVLENRDIPEKIFAVLGVDHTDLIGNLANYRAQLNTRIAKANSLAVPANFNIFKRRAVMGSVVLTDEPNRPTQIIVPVADGFFKFDGTNPAGSTLNYVIPGQTSQHDSFAKHAGRGGDHLFIKSKVRVNDYFRLLDELLTVLLSNEDINIMSGDIIKAYGDNLYRLPFIEDNEMQDIVHDENLLLQFTNSTVLDIPTASFTRFVSGNKATGLVTGNNIVKFETSTPGQPSDYPVITQRNGSIVAACYAYTSDTWVGKIRTYGNTVPLIMLENAFIDTTDGNAITPENILEWTRLTMCFKEGATIANWTLEAGVEIGLGWLVALPGSTVNFESKVAAKFDRGVTISNQWFQFGRRNSLDSRIAVPDPDQVLFNPDYPIYLTYVVNEGLNNPFAANEQENYCRRFNTMYASKFMEGLSYGPRHYEAGTIKLVNNNNNLGMYGDMAVGKLGQKTALASRFNITAMHDAALLGLISSPYVTTSK